MKKRIKNKSPFENQQSQQGLWGNLIKEQNQNNNEDSNIHVEPIDTQSNISTIRNKYKQIETKEPPRKQQQSKKVPKSIIQILREKYKIKKQQIEQKKVEQMKQINQIDTKQQQVMQIQRNQKLTQTNNNSIQQNPDALIKAQVNTNIVNEQLNSKFLFIQTDTDILNKPTVNKNQIQKQQIVNKKCLQQQQNKKQVNSYYEQPNNKQTIQLKDKKSQQTNQQSQNNPLYSNQEQKNQLYIRHSKQEQKNQQQTHKSNHQELFRKQQSANLQKPQLRNTNKLIQTIQPKKFPYNIFSVKSFNQFYQNLIQNKHLQMFSLSYFLKPQNMINQQQVQINIEGDWDNIFFDRFVIKGQISQHQADIVYKYILQKYKHDDPLFLIALIKLPLNYILNHKQQLLLNTKHLIHTIWTYKAYIQSIHINKIYDALAEQLIQRCDQNDVVQVMFMGRMKKNLLKKAQERINGKNVFILYGKHLFQKTEQLKKEFWISELKMAKTLIQQKLYQKGLQMLNKCSWAGSQNIHLKAQIKTLRQQSIAILQKNTSEPDTGIISFLNSGIDKIKQITKTNQQESNKQTSFYDDDRGRWVVNGKIYSDSEDQKEKSQKVNQPLIIPPPPPPPSKTPKQSVKRGRIRQRYVEQ